MLNLYEATRHFRSTDTNRLKVKRWKTIFHENGIRGEKKPGQQYLYQIKQTLKQRLRQRDKEGHCIITKGSFQQEDITIVNIYVPNKETPKYIKQILTVIKGETDRNTIVEDLASHLYHWIDHSDRKSETVTGNRKQ